MSEPMASMVEAGTLSASKKGADSVQPISIFNFVADKPNRRRRTLQNHATISGVLSSF